jgi:glycosyltransferase involved in cell wall biosynthesis
MGNLHVIQVATGMISIPPNGWGAVERIIWAYQDRLQRLGHLVDIRYVNQVEKAQNTIVHTHIANLALDCKNRGIPYVFSLHDHHSEWYGKGSFVFNQNLEAIKGSVISFTHAEHLVEYFSETDKLFYLPHGVDTEFFTPSAYFSDSRRHALLMLANNGLAGNSGFDRKGFRFGIEAAKQLNLPITVVGTDNNLKFFEAHQDLLEYEKLNIVANNPSDEETRALYQNHTIFLHPSMLEAGHPNLTLLEAASVCLPIVGTYKGSKEIKGLHIINEINTNEVVLGIEKTMADYDEIRDSMLQVRHHYDWTHVANKLAFFYKFVLKVDEKYDSNRTKELYKQAYNETIKYVQI